MSKLRIYELAKELGMDNKAILALCKDLGIDGKTSHSNSVSDFEADTIRRSVIRSAIDPNETTVKEVKKEGSLLTEKRVGNVIRRRKKSESEEQSAISQAEETEETTQIEAEDLSQAKDSERRIIRRKKETDSEVSLSEHEQVASSQEATEEVAESEGVLEAEESNQEALTISEGSEAVENVEQVEEEFSISNFSSTSVSKDELEQPRAAKVLGKISLPKAPAPSARNQESASTASVADESDESSSAKSSKKKKSRVEFFDDDSSKKGGKDAFKKRKKQVLRKDDLLDYEGDREVWRHKKSKKKAGGKAASSLNEIAAPMKASKKVVKIDGQISVGELAKSMGLKSSEVIGTLMKLGMMYGINQYVDFDTASLVCEEFGFTTTNVENNIDEQVSDLLKDDELDSAPLRPPVVTVMGHVDHGKTSLLDAIRKTGVAEKEAGGITQHIGAYNVKVPTGGSVTFLDTPGHAAFTEMRSRGAHVTDIVVLVVAADDGVMPQTIEAINHAKAAGVPIIVAVNKIDKEQANPERIKQQLSEHGLISEDWGGDTIFVHVSAKSGTGIDLLLENLNLQSEILELKARPDRAAIGTVVESRLDKGRGPVITVLVQRGTLKKGDIFAAGSSYGKVRALISDSGDAAEEAGPSIPVEILGASDVPKAGEHFLVVESEAKARSIAESGKSKLKIEALGSNPEALTLESFSMFVNSGEKKELPLILKADVQGSVEALAGTLLKLSDDKVAIKIVHKAVGGITENDVQLARAANAIILAFNVRAETRAAAIAESEKVQILYSRVIYELVENIEKAMHGLLDPEFVEETIGRVEVRETFRVPKLGVVAGSYVTDGIVKRGAQLRLLRDNKVVYEGKMASLRRFKDDVKEVSTGYECGIGIEGYSDIKDGDIIEVYQVKEVRPQA